MLRSNNTFYIWPDIEAELYLLSDKDINISTNKVLDCFRTWADPKDAEKHKPNPIIKDIVTQLGLTQSIVATAWKLENKYFTKYHELEKKCKEYRDKSIILDKEIYGDRANYIQRIGFSPNKELIEQLDQIMKDWKIADNELYDLKKKGFVSQEGLITRWLDIRYKQYGYDREGNNYINVYYELDHNGKATLIPGDDINKAGQSKVIVIQPKEDLLFYLVDAIYDDTEYKHYDGYTTPDEYYKLFKSGYEKCKITVITDPDIREYDDGNMTDDFLSTYADRLDPIPNELDNDPMFQKVESTSFEDDPMFQAIEEMVLSKFDKKLTNLI